LIDRETGQTIKADDPRYVDGYPFTLTDIGHRPQRPRLGLVQ